MLERRRQPRNRVYYGGLIAFNSRSSTLSCVAKNLSPTGARLQLDSPDIAPDVIDISFESKKVAFIADVVWRGGREIGVAFRERIHSSGETPLDWAMKLRACERDRKRLQQRIDNLTNQ